MAASNIVVGITHTYTPGKSGVLSENAWQFNCACCGRKVGLPNGSRGLCDACEEDIPDHIPDEQYKTYMKEVWRKR